MYRSAEVRWFVQDELPGDVRQWFEAGGQTKSEPQRTDEYLLLPGCVTTSVKFRNDRFEVKALTESPVPVTYQNAISGLRDAWVKWSSTTVDIDDFRCQVMRPEDEWISVSKSRRLRLISLEAGEPQEVAPDHGWLSGGCQVELSAIRAWSKSEDQSPAEPWWSLSFEAFGDPETMHDGLDRVIREFFRKSPPVNLKQESSFSYPVWLARLQ